MKASVWATMVASGMVLASTLGAPQPDPAPEPIVVYSACATPSPADSPRPFPQRADSTSKQPNVNQEHSGARNRQRVAPAPCGASPPIRDWVPLEQAVAAAGISKKTYLRLWKRGLEPFPCFTFPWDGWRRKHVYEHDLAIALGANYRTQHMKTEAEEFAEKFLSEIKAEKLGRAKGT